VGEVQITEAGLESNMNIRRFKESAAQCLDNCKESSNMMRKASLVNSSLLIMFED
jgi:hypothetical protein